MKFGLFSIRLFFFWLGVVVYLIRVLFLFFFAKFAVTWMWISKRNNMLSLRTHHWLLIKRFKSFSIHYQHMNRYLVSTKKSCMFFFPLHSCYNSHHLCSCSRVRWEESCRYQTTSFLCKFLKVNNRLRLMPNWKSFGSVYEFLIFAHWITLQALWGNRGKASSSILVRVCRRSYTGHKNNSRISGRLKHQCVKEVWFFLSVPSRIQLL